jgi:hypothetical protein
MSSFGLSGPVLAAPSKRRVEIIWADKAAMCLAIGWAGLLLAAGLMAIVAWGFAGACLLAKDTAVLAVEAGLALVLPIWFALTGIDLLLKGPARRRARGK